jgi:hypothetical protein
MKEPLFPTGHFYSPVVDTDDIVERSQRIWVPQPCCHGIDFNPEFHLRVLDGWFPSVVLHSVCYLSDDWRE